MPIALAAGKEGHLFALLHTKVIAVIETEKLTVSRTFEVKEFEPTALSYSTATNEIWVGDKTGSLYILNADDFSQK